MKNIISSDFQVSCNYTLESDFVFYAKDNSGKTITQLVDIINKLKDMHLEYSVDDNYNIKIQSQAEEKLNLINSH